MPIILPGWQQSSQPQAPSEINWGNPLSRGLRFLISPVGRAAVEHVSGLTPSTNSASVSYGPLGAGLDFQGGTQAVFPHRAAFDVLGDLTIIAFVRVDTLSNFSALISKNSGTTTNLPFELRLGAGSGADGKIQLIRAAAAGYKSWDGSASSIVSASADVQCIAVTHAATIQTAPTFYVNGTPFTGISSGGTGTGAPTSNSGTLYVGKRGDGITFLDGAIFMVAAWGRILSAAEIQDIRANPWQLFRPQSVRVPINAQASSGNTIAVPAGNLSLAGFAPSVVQTANQRISIPAGTLSLAGLAPTVAVSDKKRIAVPAGALSLAGFAPTVSVSASKTIAVPAGTLNLTAFAPVVVSPRRVSVPAGSLTLAGFAPTVTVTAAKIIQVPAGGLTITGFAPTVSATANNVVAVPAGSLTLTGYAPTVSNGAAEEELKSRRIVRRGKTKFPRQEEPPEAEEVKEPPKPDGPKSLLDGGNMQLLVQQGAEAAIKKARVASKKRRLQIEREDEKAIEAALLEWF